MPLEGTALESTGPLRDEGLRRLAAFVPRAGRLYAAERNYDRSPADRANVSTLSPFVRHRLVTETEVLAAVLERFSLATAEKFVQEVFWRTYWKGWLEAHPVAWTRYCETLEQRLAELAADSEHRAAYDAAVEGRTGIDAFDAWARELVAHNYLHNHARMWFASIWIFTLRLPWELGADFFMRHLLDGDPAANTLSWRWVAGLQTRGKTYTATRDNIRRYTGERFALTTPLARSVEPLDDAAIPLRPRSDVPLSFAGKAPLLFVIHEDDFHGDLRDVPAGDAVAGVCAIRSVAGRSPLPMSPAVREFTATASSEAVARVAASIGARDCGVLDADGGPQLAAAFAAAARTAGAQRIVAAFAPVGPTRDLLDSAVAGLAAAELPYAELGRRYDAVSWPAATRGFFNLRSRIPAIVGELGIGAA